LPASAQHQLFSGIDALASPGSHVAVEEAVPLDADTFGAACSGTRVVFGARLAVEGHALNSYLQWLGRPVPELDSEAGVMIGNISLVSATKS
jgi:hypothetical protein